MDNLLFGASITMVPSDKKCGFKLTNRGYTHMPERIILISEYGNERDRMYTLIHELCHIERTNGNHDRPFYLQLREALQAQGFTYTESEVYEHWPLGIDWEVER